MARKAEYLDWISEVAKAIGAINGSYPVSDPQIIITPIGKQVAWDKLLAGFGRGIKLSDSEIFTGLYHQLQQQRFPELMPVLKALGFNGLKVSWWAGLSEEAVAIME